MPRDLLVRYGGEEFALLLPDCGLDDAMAIAERLRTAQPEGTCSIGVAAWNIRETEAELVRRADQALYAAKTGGRNRCHASVEGAPEPAERDAAGGDDERAVAAGSRPATGRGERAR